MAYIGWWVPISYEKALSILNNNNVTQIIIIGSYHGLLATVVDETKIDNDNKCTLFAGHFDGRAGAQMKYGIHLPTYQVQGFTGSLWMLSSSMYLPCIAL
jgi:hypothetical protein